MERPRTVLVVDDEPNIRLLIRTVLETSAIRALEAGEGSQALELVRVEELDLILLDWEMPGVGGEEFLRLLEAEVNSTPPIMVITGSADTGVVRKHPRVTDFLAKPFDLDELTERVSRLLG